MPSDADIPAMARLLAEIHTARELARRPRPVREAAVSDRDLWAHARRRPGAPVSLAVTRALRTQAAAAARYRAMLASLAVAHAPFAIAASDGAVTRRRVGDLTLEIVPEDEGSPPLLVITGIGDAVPRLIEVGRDGDDLRLALPEPVAGAIVLALDPTVPDALRLGELLRDPRSEVYLV